MIGLFLRLVRFGERLEGSLIEGLELLVLVEVWGLGEASLC